MASQEYLELLKNPKWQKLRLEVLDARGWKCELMGETDISLNVHHRRYVRGAMPWEYEPEQLQVLCEECHKDLHDWKNSEDRWRLLERTHDLIGKFKTLYTDGSWAWSWCVYGEKLSAYEDKIRKDYCARLERTLERFKKFESGEVQV